jgi:hypothetical protein
MLIQVLDLDDIMYPDHEWMARAGPGMQGGQEEGRSTSRQAASQESGLLLLAS